MVYIIYLVLDKWDQVYTNISAQLFTIENNSNIINIYNNLIKAIYEEFYINSEYLTRDEYIETLKLLLTNSMKYLEYNNQSYISLSYDDQDMLYDIITNLLYNKVEQKYIKDINITNFIV